MEEWGEGVRISTRVSDVRQRFHREGQPWRVAVFIVGRDCDFSTFSGAHAVSW
jgi:hypothetical protein